MSSTPHTKWIVADAAKLRETIKDRNGNALEAARGTTQRWRFGLFDSSQLDDLTDFTAITVEVKPAGATENTSAVMQEVLNAAAINETLTLSEWSATTASHLDVTFTSGETNNASAGNYLLCVWGTTAGGLKKTWLSQSITFIEDGCGETTTAPDPVESFYTSTEVDALVTSSLLNHYTKTDLARIVDLQTLGIPVDGSDASSALQAAVDTGAKRFIFPAGGTVECTSVINITGDDVTFDLNGCTLKCRSDKADGTDLLNVTGDRFRLVGGTIDHGDVGTVSGLVSAGTGAIRISGSGCTIEKNTLKRYNGHSIYQVAGDGTTIRRNRFEGLDIQDCWAMTINRSLSGLATEANDIVIRENYCHGSAFCSVTGNASTLFSRVIVQDNKLLKRATLSLRCVRAIITGNYIDVEHAEPHSGWPGFAFAITYDRGYAGIISNNYIKGFLHCGIEYVGLEAELPASVPAGMEVVGAVISSNLVINDHATLSPDGIRVDGVPAGSTNVNGNTLFNCGMFVLGEGSATDPVAAVGFIRDVSITCNKIDSDRTGFTPFRLRRAIRAKIEGNTVNRSVTGSSVAFNIDQAMVYLDSVCADIVIKNNTARNLRYVVYGPAAGNTSATLAGETSNNITVEDNIIYSPDDPQTESNVIYPLSIKMGAYRVSGNSVRSFKQIPTAIGCSGWSTAVAGSGSVAQSPVTISVVSGATASSTAMAYTFSSGWIARKASTTASIDQLAIGGGWHVDLKLHNYQLLRGYDSGAGSISRIIFGKNRSDNSIGLVTNYGSTTSGTLTNATWYQIVTYVAGDDFTNVGGANVTGSIFKSTGTTPTTWTNGSRVTPLYRTFGFEFRGTDAYGFYRNDTTGAVDYAALSLPFGADRNTTVLPLFMQSHGTSVKSWLHFGFAGQVYGSMFDLPAAVGSGGNGMTMGDGLHLEVQNGNQASTHLVLSGMQLTDFNA